MATDVSGVSTTNQSYVEAMQQSSDSSSFAPDNVMGQADFLRLLTTQLQNQDPSQPMDPASFVTDLTQMSQLEATTKMNESITAMMTGFLGMQTMQASSLIGKNVLVTGEDFSHVEGEASNIQLNLDQPLEDVTVVISDVDGLVTEIFLDDLNSGEKNILWNGEDREGNSRDSGVYSLTVYGTDEAGELQSIDTVVASRVNTVTINDDGSMSLTLATGEKVNMDSVREISG